MKLMTNEPMDLSKNGQLVEALRRGGSPERDVGYDQGPILKFENEGTTSSSTQEKDFVGDYVKRTTGRR